jgi:c-di-GMP-binding flagellar brake protein YcgR
LFQHRVAPSRRLVSRIDNPDGVWVYWHCDGRAETSAVQNLSLGGVFLRTAGTMPVDSRAQVHFLVQEGQVRIEAVIRHLRPGLGMGLRFTAIKDGDRSNLLRLLNRLRNPGRDGAKPITSSPVNDVVPLA